MRRNKNLYKKLINEVEQGDTERRESSSPRRLSQESLTLSPEAKAEEDLRTQRIDQLRTKGQIPNQQEVMDIAQNASQIALSSVFGVSSSRAQGVDPFSDQFALTSRKKVS